MMERHFGIYRARVMDANDPTARGRVQVLVPGVSGQTSGWAMPCGPQRARVGDIAWVMFEAGDPDRPVIIGTVPS